MKMKRRSGSKVRIGDGARLGLWMTLVVLSVLEMIVLLTDRRKRKAK